MHGFTHFAGVDFSGARGALSNLWSAIGVERKGRLHVVSLQPHPFRADLAEFLLEGWPNALAGPYPDNPLMLCGLDFPLSIPHEAARSAIDEPDTWEAVNAWLAQRSPDEVAQALDAYRKTPRACDKALALAPLDLRLFKQTVNGARWLHELIGGSANHQVSVYPHAPVAGAPLTLIEVYPSISRNDLGIKAGRKPKRPGEIRSRPASVRSYLTFDHPSMEATAMTIEDAWDATLACLSTYLVREDLAQPQRLGLIDGRAAQIEGWIYRHPQAWKS